MLMTKMSGFLSSRVWLFSSVFLCTLIFTVCKILDFIWIFLFHRLGISGSDTSIPITLTLSPTIYKILDFISTLFSFSQVGGFLGLLLGASILTVCEILDFIVLAVAAIWNEKKNKGQVTHLEVAEADHNGFNQDEKKVKEKEIA